MLFTKNPHFRSKILFWFSKWPLHTFQVCYRTINVEAAGHRTWDAAVAIRKTVEYDSNADDILCLIDYFGCRTHIHNIVRIGRLSNSPSNSHLFKIQLSSVTVKAKLLHCAKYLKGDPTTSTVTIWPWHHPDNLKRHKATQELCRTLKNKFTVLNDGRKPYVVIRGKLMKRQSDRSLRPSKPSPTPIKLLLITWAVSLNHQWKLCPIIKIAACYRHCYYGGCIIMLNVK